MFLMVFLANALFPQNKHLVYLSTLNNAIVTGGSSSFIDIDSSENLFHLLIVSKKNSITYAERPEVQIIDSLGNKLSENREIKLFKKRKHECTSTQYIHSYRRDTLYLNLNMRSWIEIDSTYLRAKYDQIEKEIKLLQAINPDIDFSEELHTKYFMEFKKGLNTKMINGFLCQEGILNVTDIESYHVWYTEEMCYNWCFDDFRSIVPGTIVQLLKNDTEEIVFELIEVKELDYKDILLTKHQISELLKHK